MKSALRRAAVAAVSVTAAAAAVTVPLVVDDSKPVPVADAASLTLTVPHAAAPIVVPQRDPQLHALDRSRREVVSRSQARRPLPATPHPTHAAPKPKPRRPAVKHHAAPTHHPVAHRAAVKPKPKPKPRPTATRHKVTVRAVTGDARGYARSVLSSTQYRCLDLLFTRESGWSARASNPSSGAYGIPQALPGSKMSSAGADWRTNAVTQVEWGLGYIAARYGSPCAAWAHSEATGWY